MEIQTKEFQDVMFDYVDRIKELLSPTIWQNILLDCSKNEILVLWLLYRNHEVNMSQIAEYIQVPLNTATGIVGRMEKKQFVFRARSKEDKRVVTIQMAEQGQKYMGSLMGELTYYGTQVMQAFSPEEINLFTHMMDKIVEILTTERKKEEPAKKVRKITIQ